MSEDDRILLDGAAKAALARTRDRLLILCLGFVLAFGVLIARLTEVTVLREEVARAPATQTDSVSVARVDITDRNGEILATDLRGTSLFADARVIWDPKEAAQSLGKVIDGLDVKAVARKLSTRQAFVWIKRGLTAREHDQVHDLGIPGLYFREEPRRVYPNGRSAAHVLGYVNVDNHGLAGIERGLDEKITDPSRNGRPVPLSLDLRVQHALQDELAGAMATFQAIGAAGIVLNVNNGEVLALCSLPDFDPNEPIQPDADGLFNRATLGVFEMGSTFKTFTTAMALDSGKVTLSTRYDARKPLQVGRFTISDFHPENRWLTVPEIFMHSSNIGTAQMAVDVGTDAQKAFLAKMGLLQPVVTEIHEAGTPKLPRQWHEIETMTIGYGHGLAVTPMQVAMASAAVVNGGKLIHPTFLLREQGEAAPFTRVISDETSREMRELLRLVVTGGTGGKADVPGYPVAGKTGTAEKASNGGYAHTKLLSSFMGVFPAQHPEYLVLIILDEPHGTKQTFGYATAGWTAAPTAGNVIRRIAPMLNVQVAPIEPGPHEPTTMAAAFEESH
ncbi:MAG: penicillin-binding protein 2 [Alphaproteobacteria bacterium]|nr:penicillin-binding protein 2 [Alphaproteobacteria bacterium]